MRVTGKVVRFDDVRGYGFISPDIGGDDVFLHANDLEMEKPLAKPGVKVSFGIEEGARGKFATAVRLADSAASTSSAGASHIEGTFAGGDADEYYDVLSVEQFRHLVTEMLLHLAPPVTGPQIVVLRDNLEKLARKQGWIEP